MAAKRFGLFFLLFAILSTSSCALRRPRAESLEVSERYAIVESSVPGQKYLLIKNIHDLEQTLKHMGCKQHPCSVGRLGELYVVFQPAQKAIKN